ncbi:3-deoxy-D-manno-octulosonic acid transferase [Psychrobacter sp. P11F6]|nr:3-deoxy-D-manno-octulosonic acid transferase [Psychrobacter sp. P11F6]
MPSRTVYTAPLYYQCAIGLLKPLYRLQVWQRSHNRDNYQQEAAQRFGKQYPPRPVAKVTHAQTDKGVIWCHAVSLGETNTVAPLLDTLLADGYQIWLTNTTQTGFARGASRFAEDIEQGRFSHSYVPVDSPAVIERFLNHVQPVAALFVETELWANILTKLSEHHIPSILVNGRLSASSFKSYQKIAAVSASMMKNLTLIIAQDSDSAKRFRQLGANSAQIRVAGSLKWVINTPQTEDKAADIEADTENPSVPNQYSESVKESTLAKEMNIAGRPIWVAASTHSGEEETALSLHQQLLSHPALADALLIIVPRHPERFDEVAALIQASELTMARRSAEDSIHVGTQVYLADSMGELMAWYKLADVALVGGSLVDVGGHNPVEPASVATPVLMGRYTQSCQSVVDKLADVGALYQPNNVFYRPVTVNMATTNDDTNQQSSRKKPAAKEDVALIYQQLVSWLSDLEVAEQAGQAGARMTRQQQAVLTRQFTMVKEVVEQHAIQQPSQELL